MSKELALFDNIPEYAMTGKVAPEAFEDLLGGLSVGSVPSIRVKNGKFRTVIGNEEKVIPSKNLAEGEFLPVIILKAKKALSKSYYATAYDPANEPEAPDCWSIDGERPDKQVKKPVCDTCAACPMNAFGSGRNQNGEPTKGKACTDNKIMAVAYAGSVYQMKIPPASLKGFGSYIRLLMSKNVTPGNVVTYIGLDEDSDFPILTFHPGMFVPSNKLEVLAELSESQEVRDIINPTFSAQAPALPAPAKAVSKGGADPLAAGDGDDEEEAETAPVKKAPAKKAPAKKAAAKKEPEPEETDEESGEDDGGVPSDDELNALLGF